MIDTTPGRAIQRRMAGHIGRRSFAGTATDGHAIAVAAIATLIAAATRNAPDQPIQAVVKNSVRANPN